VACSLSCFTQVDGAASIDLELVGDGRKRESSKVTNEEKSVQGGSPGAKRRKTSCWHRIVLYKNGGIRGGRRRGELSGGGKKKRGEEQGRLGGIIKVREG
jgi:hypothetical protein